MLSARKPDSKPKEQPMEGTHVARLLGITDLGHQDGFTYQGKEIDSSWNYEFTYELVNHDMEDGRPFVVSETVPNKDWENTATGMSTKLVARCKSILGKEYRLGVEDLSKILGGACMVTVAHNDKGYSKIPGTAAVGSVPFGMEVKELHNQTYIFDMDDPDMDLFEAMPDFKKEKITGALNFNDTKLAKIMAEGDQF